MWHMDIIEVARVYYTCDNQIHVVMFLYTK